MSTRSGARSWTGRRTMNLWSRSHSSSCLALADSIKPDRDLSGFDSSSGAATCCLCGRRVLGLLRRRAHLSARSGRVAASGGGGNAHARLLPPFRADRIGGDLARDRALAHTSALDAAAVAGAENQASFAHGAVVTALDPEPFRYGAVFLLTVALVVFVIAAPSANWSRAVALAIEGVALVVAIATGRARKELRYRRAMGVGVAILLVVASIWSAIISRQLTSVVTALVTAAVPVVIVGGLLRLLRERGVTLQGGGRRAGDLPLGRSRVRGDHRLHRPGRLDAVLRPAHERHRRRSGLLQLHSADDHRFRRFSPRLPSATP